jgi:N-acetylgalactosamine-N,N'-diacetylbacillosaminyl-diphospho-undecaprenol 4-alpha-N-acetylgalactosaminyltransferase
MAKKKLAILINSLSKGGAEKIVSLLIQRYYTEFDLHLILLNPTIDFDLPLSEITVHLLDDSNLHAKSRAREILKLPALGKRLKRYLEKEQIPVCYSFLARPNFIAGMAKWWGWKGKSIIAERQHTSSYYIPGTLMGNTGRFLVRNLYRHADIITSNSKEMEHDLRHNYGLHNPSRVIYNPIDITEHQKQMHAEVPEWPASDLFTFVHVGRMAPQKNHALLVEAMRLLRDEPCRVLLLGRGPLEPALRQRVEEFGLQEKVLFVGFHANVVAWVHKADAFVLCSDFEGFPNALLESLACGTPSISTDCLSGPRELLYQIPDRDQKIDDVVEADFGLLCPMHDAESLAKGMRLLMQNEPMQERYRALGPQRAAEFDLPRIMGHFDNLLYEVVK